MPIVDVEIVVDTGATFEADLARRLADAIGDVLGSSAGSVWVRLRALDRMAYAENASPAPDPVFVTVLERTLPDDVELRQRAATIAETVASLTDRPTDNVHVVFEPPGRGRVAFGGQLVV